MLENFIDKVNKVLYNIYIRKIKKIKLIDRNVVKLTVAKK